MRIVYVSTLKDAISDLRSGALGVADCIGLAQLEGTDKQIFDGLWNLVPAVVIVEGNNNKIIKRINSYTTKDEIEKWVAESTSKTGAA